MLYNQTKPTTVERERERERERVTALGRRGALHN